MLRVKVFTFGDLDSLSVWFSLMVEKEGDLGRKRPSRSDQREDVVGRSGCLAGWVGVAVSLPFSLGKKLAFPKSYSEQKPQCTLSELV